MSNLNVQNDQFEQRTRQSFSRQPFMAMLGVELSHVRAGFVEFQIPYRPQLCQQHGYFHGGLIGTLADNAGAYAAFTLVRETDSVLTVEYKVNFLSPGQGKALIARGQVLKPGRHLTVSEAKIYADVQDEWKLCATAICTLMTMENMPDHKGT